LFDPIFHRLSQPLHDPDGQQPPDHRHHRATREWGVTSQWPIELGKVREFAHAVTLQNPAHHGEARCTAHVTMATLCWPAQLILSPRHDCFAHMKEALDAA
jgi:hypothetical protein